MTTIKEKKIGNKNISIVPTAINSEKYDIIIENGGRCCLLRYVTNCTRELYENGASLEEIEAIYDRLEKEEDVNLIRGVAPSSMNERILKVYKEGDESKIEELSNEITEIIKPFKDIGSKFFYSFNRF